jgi:2-keto-4-pentenoate hydratase/2-oxohepta-3-ene-1,7-dioic acid hydratase in catechol pathway
LQDSRSTAKLLIADAVYAQRIRKGIFDMAQSWVRFTNGGASSFGLLEGNEIHVHSGDMFTNPSPTGKKVRLEEVTLLAPTQPTKIVAMWNNFRALGQKLNLATPPEPLYLIKSPNSYLNPGEQIKKPSQEGKVVFEGELGIVIGKTAKEVSESQADEYIFGYTVANDVTLADVLNRDPSFAQWVRAKGFDTFCPFGPTVTRGIDPKSLTVKTVLNGDVRQDYPISDMLFSAQQLVSKISHDMTLYPGDIILCGTSVGVGSMKPGSVVEVEIAGIGKLTNRFE